MQLVKVDRRQDRYHTADTKASTFQAIVDALYLGYTAIEACQRAGISKQTLVTWIGNDREMADAYARARAEQAHVYADQALLIADEAVRSMEDAQRNRLRVDTRKWLASKMLPRVYGERIISDHTHRVGVVMLPAINGAGDPQSSALPAEADG